MAEDRERHELVEVEQIEEVDDLARAERSDVAVDEGPVTVGDLVEGANKVVGAVGTGAKRIFDQGRYRKVRITRKGKPILPDIPLAAMAAVEAASLYGAGFARVLAVNVGARFLFDVEVVNEADKYMKSGVEHFLEGDLNRAEEALLKCVRIDDTHAPAYLQLGVLYRMRGERDKAIQVLERARRLDDAGEVGKKAGDILIAMSADEER
ncbi:MAG: hypothetical protein RMA76_07855 [Deltaproteobacteria bacterium]